MMRLLAFDAVMPRQSASKPSTRFAIRSIRTKLALLVVAAIGLSVAIGTSVAALQEAVRYVSAKREALLATAVVFARASAQPVADRNEQAILVSIAGLRDVEGVRGVEVYAPDGALITDLGQAVVLSRDAVVTLQPQRVFSRAFAALVWSVYQSRSIVASVPIVHNGDVTVGSITIVADASDFQERVGWTVLATTAGGLVALLFGLGVAFWLQRRITAPITELAATMAHVRVVHDFGIMAKRTTQDEVGDLVTSFNAMIGEIRERDIRLARHRATLEQDVADRTRDLRIAKIAAETANAAKSDFLATMSHEIRTPMNGMLVMAELLAAADMPARPRRYAEVIARSGQSLLAIINDILDFSKVEAGKMELEAIPLDPAETADTVLNLFWERAQRKNLDLAASVAPDVPASIIGDPVRLNQVIGNLVNNALKFTEAGYVLLSIGRDPHDPSRIRFAITDTGIGIPQDKIDTLFEAFAQVDQTTTRKFGGTGLGLAICKRLVDAMGGGFRVTSEAGRGSTFAFSFPILGPAAPREVPQVEAPGLLTRRRAVVAIRGDATARIAADLIASCGYAVERRDADDLASGLPPVDLVVVEGTVLAGLPIPAPALRPRHVIAVTTMGDGAERHLEDGRRSDAALVRPLAHTEMLALLRRIVEGRPLDGAAGQRKARLAAVPQVPGRCVLVADDSAVNREVAVEALSRLGVRAEVVEDGRTAVEAARRGGIDLILMDGSMPDIDGFEASRQIRAREAADGTPRLPIVALTAHVVGSAADLWRDAGMDGILHKPFTIAAMAECLAPFLQQGEGEAGSAAVGAEPRDALVADPASVDDVAGQAPASEGPPRIDPDVMEQLESMASADGGAFLARILGLYREHAPRTVSDFAACVASGATEDQAKAAHALKSMSYNVGAARIAAAAGEIERIIRVDGGRVDAGHAAALEALLAETLAAFAARHPVAFGEPSRIVARA